MRDRFIVLGWVPHGHTFDLIRQSVAVLQPSLFEGWSTTVEETKSIGKAIVMSDIPIHREQSPAGAIYFDPNDAASLAEGLIQVFDTCSPGPDLALEALARQALPERTRAYARDLHRRRPRGDGIARRFALRAATTKAVAARRLHRPASSDR